MPDWNDDQIVLVSAIEHYSYCPRQCALIHIEHIFDENIFTLRGSMAHTRVDEPIQTQEQEVRIERALPIWSDEYGLQGKADVVEFHDDGSIVPVEYKLGGKRPGGHDDLQLCAQAACLEEMFGIAITAGAIYSIKSHRRRDVIITAELKEKTLEVVKATRTMLASSVTPEPVNDSRCRNCSLLQACMPETLAIALANTNVFIPVGMEVPE
jgi:CRISPR-associated exonuclease Cas4